MVEVTWKIHGISDMKEEFPGKDHIGNFHTHGLNEYNNQKELCIVLDLPAEKACGLLNAMGLRVANEETVFTEGIRTDVLENGMEVQFITFDDDPTLYVILPDPNGKLPMDDNCEEPYSYQYKYAELIHNDQGYV